MVVAGGEVGGGERVCAEIDKREEGITGKGGG